MEIKVRQLIYLSFFWMVTGFSCFTNTHLYFADVFMNIYPIAKEKEKVEFIAGVCAADIVGINEEADTNFELLTPNELMHKAWFAPSFYEKGLYLHRYVDAKCISLMKGSEFSKRYPEIVKDEKLFFFILDEMIYNKRRCAFARNILLDVAADEMWRSFGVEGCIGKLKGQLLDYIAGPPAVWIKEKCLDTNSSEIVEKFSKKWVVYDFMHLLHQSVNRDLATVFFKDQNLFERLKRYIMRSGE